MNIRIFFIITKIIIFSNILDFYRFTVKGRVGEFDVVLAEVHNGEIHLVTILTYTGTTANDLLELGHGIYRAVESHHFAGLCIYSCTHKAARHGNDGKRLMGVSEIV